MGVVNLIRADAGGFEAWIGDTIVGSYPEDVDLDEVFQASVGACVRTIGNSLARLAQLPRKNHFAIAIEALNAHTGEDLLHLNKKGHRTTSRYDLPNSVI